MECCRTHVAGCHLVDNGLVFGAEWEGRFDGGEMGQIWGKIDNTLYATFTEGLVT